LADGRTAAQAPFVFLRLKCKKPICTERDFLDALRLMGRFLRTKKNPPALSAILSALWLVGLFSYN
jgi:hypothetical protein